GAPAARCIAQGKRNRGASHSRRVTSHGLLEIASRLATQKIQDSPLEMCRISAGAKGWNSILLLQPNGAASFACFSTTRVVTKHMLNVAQKDTCARLERQALR